jgi:hypothetical protein
MPSAAPGNVTPRTSRMSSTAYGKSAVNHTTCGAHTRLCYCCHVVLGGDHFSGDVTVTDLPRCGDSFPEAEVADKIHSQKTQGHVPLDGTQIM